MTPNESLKLVEQFHCRFSYRQPTPQAPDLSDVRDNKLRVELLQEEAREFWDSCERHSALGILDALCDLQYVLSGAVLALGFARVYEAAVAFKYREVPKQDYVIARIDSKLMAMRIFKVSLSNFESNLIAKHEHGVLSSLASMQYVFDRLVMLCGLTMQFPDAFKEVHRTNLAKAWSEPEVIEYQNTGLNGLTFTRIDGAELFVARRGDGKILKPASWVPPNLEQYL